MNMGDGWETPEIVRQRRKGLETPAEHAHTLGHPAAQIVMVTCRLVTALATGREDE